MVELGVPTEYDFALPRLRHELFVRHALPLVPGLEALLDYGCGNGANTRLFSGNFRAVDGIDVEPERIDEANARNTNANVSYTLYGGQAIPASRQYDAVVSFEVLEHTESDAGSLRQIFERLKPGGVLMCTVPNKYYLMETHGFNFPFQDSIPYHRIPFLNLLPKWVYDRYGNARIYTRQQICGLVKDAGFHLAESGYLRAPLDKIRNPRVRSVVSRGIAALPESMGVSVWLVATKPAG